LTLSAGFAFAHGRFDLLRKFTTVLGLAPLIFSWSYISSIGMLKAKNPIEAETPGNRVVKVGSPAPIVFLILDEFPLTSILDVRGGIDAALLPNLARFADHSTWFRNASTVNAWTSLAVPAILTGRNVSGVELGRVETHSDTLFGLLGDSYRLNVYERTSGMFRPEGGLARLFVDLPDRLRPLILDLSILYLHTVLPDEWTHSLPAADQDWKDFRHRINSSDRFDDFMRSIRKSEEPALHFLHSRLPHRPWQYLPSGLRYHPPEDPGAWGMDKSWGPADFWVLQAYQRHLLQVGYVDVLLGNLFEHLETIGMFDESLIVITSDHGISFWPRGNPREVSRKAHPEDVLGVPLFIKAPHQRVGRMEVRGAETIDILPTIADLLEANIPWQVDGCSLVAKDCPERSTKRMGGRFKVRSYPADILLQRRALERKQRLFGGGLYAVGPYRSLVGREVASFRRSDPAALRVSLDLDAFEFADAHPGDFTVARLTGQVHDHAPRSKATWLAIAVQGKVGAVVPVLPEGDGDSRLIFSAMLPEDARPDSESEVTLFAIQTSKTGPVLRPVTRLR
jgi:hypothetical protein